MEFLAEAVRATGRYVTVRTAIAERGLASLPEGLEACTQAGARKILVIPVFFGRDRSMVHWLSKAAYRWSRERGEPGPEVVFAGASGEHPALGEAMVRAVSDAESEASVRADDFESLEDPPAWSVIPLQERHVLACMGRAAPREARAAYTSTFGSASKSGNYSGAVAACTRPRPAASAPATWARRWSSTQRASGIAS
jgi:sirohydrochlorin ferrochelatase